MQHIEPKQKYFGASILEKYVVTKLLYFYTVSHSGEGEWKTDKRS